MAKESTSALRGGFSGEKSCLGPRVTLPSESMSSEAIEENGRV